MTTERRPAELGLFFREFRRHFHTTGAIAPSSRWLARALARYVGDGDRPRRILEVGPGTGAVTREIVAALRPDDRLDLVELNDSFVELLRRRFAEDPGFVPAAARTQIHHAPVQELSCEEPYDAIVSGLPLNNFYGDLVEDILAALARLAAPGGTLSFFEYVAVRPARSVISSTAERQRLRAVGQSIGRVLGQHGFRRELVLVNLPPAWVHHVRFGQA